MTEAISFDRSSRFTRERFEQIEPMAEEWRIYQILPAQGLAFLAGPSKAYKSFLAVACGLSIAAGIAFMESEVEPCGVAYIGAEGANGLRKRVKAWRHRHDFEGETLPFVLIPQAPDLRNSDDLGDLEATLRDERQTMANAGRPLGVVVIDTLAASMPGGDENTSADMGTVIGSLQRIARELEILILVVTHLGKDETRGIRGWSGQYAGADAVLFCVKNKDDPNQTIVTVDKLKDGEDGACFAFRLEKVGLGQDGRGRPINSAIPIFEAAPAGGAGKVRKVKLSAHAMKVKAAYGRLLDEGAGTTCPNVPGALSGLLAVTEQALRAKAFELALGGAEPEEAERKTWRKSRSTFFRRGLEQLEKEGIFRAELGYVWELHHRPDDT